VTARPPEPPRAPPFPYQFLGRLETEGKPKTVYLTKDSQVYSATPGEVIEGVYRVIDVTAESIEVMYLPLNMKQQIAFSSIVPATAPTVGRQGGRVSSTPAIVAPTSVSIPPPMNLSPPVADRARNVPPTAQTAPAETARAAQRQNPDRQSNPERQSSPEQTGAGNRGNVGQQQPAPAPATGATPPANPATAAAPPSLTPSPIVVSPPTLSAFGSSAPPSAAGRPPAPASSGAAAPAPSGAAAPATSGTPAPNAPASGRM
jgi:hypothetical protein